MKKVLSALILFVLAFSATEASAQFRWGVKAGMNYNQAPQVQQWNDLFKTQSLIGYHAGPMVEYTLPIVPISIDAAVLFSSSNAKINGTNFAIDAGVDNAIDQVIKTNYIELPINLKANVFSVAGVKLMVVAGPSFSFLVNHNLKDLGKDLTGFADFRTNKVGIGLNAGVGVEAFKFLQITATYNAMFSDSYKFTSVAQSATDFFKAQNKGFRLSAAVLF